MAFLTEPQPDHSAATAVMPGIRRLVAHNPSPMTYHGTNTYLIDGPEGLIVLDPGPDQPEHVEATLAATGGEPVTLILLSHHHRDHAGAVPALREATGAPVAAFAATPFAATSTVDRFIEDGETIAGLTALHTPGHASDHLCFAMTAADGTTPLLFSADHVMSWSSSIVSPPDGNMRQYFASLQRLLARDDVLYLPGHGPLLPDPRALTADLLAHRQAREATIARALAENGPSTTHRLMDTLYSQTDPMLRRAAERNVLAHLLKLQEEGAVVQNGEVWQKA